MSILQKSLNLQSEISRGHIILFLPDAYSAAL